MKRYLILIILGFAFIMQTCTKDEPVIGEAFSHVKGISDTWVLTHVKQSDEIAESEPLDVTDVMVGGDPSMMVFNEANRTYTLTSGSSVQFIPGSGTWAFDDEKYPSNVVVSSGGNSYTLNLQKPVREKVDDVLEFKYIRPIGDCAVLENNKVGAVGYIYTYQRKK
ncbi:MAG TPA: DUF5004 domain-containing protein [Saprospiraceae bacterium]|nr:DUF5004 domain-containing protein [Saprospiraceae bacterium]